MGKEANKPVTTPVRRYRAQHADRRRLELFVPQDVAEAIADCAARWSVSQTEAALILLEPGLRHLPGAGSEDQARGWARQTRR